MLCFITARYCPGKFIMILDTSLSQKKTRLGGGRAPGNGKRSHGPLGKQTITHYSSSYVQCLDSKVLTKTWYPGGFKHRRGTGTLSSRSCVRCTKLGGKVNAVLLRAYSNFLSAHRLLKCTGRSENLISITNSSMRLASLVTESGNHSRSQFSKSSSCSLCRLPICSGRSNRKLLTT